MGADKVTVVQYLFLVQFLSSFCQNVDVDAYPIKDSSYVRGSVCVTKKDEGGRIEMTGNCVACAVNEYFNASSDIMKCQSCQGFLTNCNRNNFSDCYDDINSCALPTKSPTEASVTASTTQQSVTTMTTSFQASDIATTTYEPATTKPPLESFTIATTALTPSTTSTITSTAKTNPYLDKQTDHTPLEVEATDKNYTLLIIIAIIFFILVIFLIGYFTCWRRKKKSEKNKSNRKTDDYKMQYKEGSEQAVSMLNSANEECHISNNDSRTNI